MLKLSSLAQKIGQLLTALHHNGRLSPHLGNVPPATAVFNGENIRDNSTVTRSGKHRVPAATPPGRGNETGLVGTNQDIETESQDRDTTSLPGPQDELVERVLDANPSTAIIVNAGRAIDLPWASKASTILYSWLPGHAFGPALAAVLAGDLEPGGRLPITIAAAPGGYPAYDTVPDSDGKLYYRDSYLVGYRGFDAARARSAFCFGHGIGYTDFSYERLTTSASHVDVNESLTASGVGPEHRDPSGKEVVRLYVPGPAHGIPAHRGSSQRSLRSTYRRPRR
jgi:Glycosyl hydrolase family 3 C-terminal domain